MDKLELVHAEVVRNFRLAMDPKGDITSLLVGQAISKDESHMNSLGEAEKAQNAHTKQKGHVQLHWKTPTGPGVSRVK